MTNPSLCDAEDDIIAGHGRVLAALKLGLKVYPPRHSCQGVGLPLRRPLTSWLTTK